MNTEFENMALLKIEDYNELKAKAEATDEQIKKQAEEMAKPEVITLKVYFDTYGYYTGQILVLMLKYHSMMMKKSEICLTKQVLI